MRLIRKGLQPMTFEYPPRAGLTGVRPPDAAVGRKLQLARTQLAASEDFVAAALGLTVEAYRCVENGTAQLSPGGVIQAAQLFGLQPSALCIDANRDALLDKTASMPSTAGKVIDFAAARRLRQG